MANDHIEIDINEYTLGELAEAEGYCGVSITPVITRQDLPAHVLMALATVAVRRTNPAFTYAEAANLKVGRFNEAVPVTDETEEAVDPTVDPTVPEPAPELDTPPAAPSLTS